MLTLTDTWAYQQKTRYTLRRRFIRDFLLNTLAFHILVTVTVHHPENVPANGGTILMINHVTGIDPIVIAGVIRQRFVNIMSKIENFENPLTALMVKNWGCYPIRRGEIDREGLKTTLDLLALGEMVLIAPEGTRQPQLTQPKEGLTYVALKANPVIVPTAVYGADTWLRDIPLPRRTPIQVDFGQPFRLRPDDRKRIPREEMSRMSAEMMYQLAALLPERYRGEYANLSEMTTDYLEFVQPSK